MSKLRKFTRTLMLLLILMGSASSLTFANSAEPPSLLILVNNPTDDISIVMISNDHQTEAQMRRTAWEGYYIFYNRDMQSNGDYTFRITTQEKSFECTFNKPLKSYNEVLTLDISDETLSYGKYPLRSVLLVSIRVVFTLLIEALVFWLFKFREKRSWIIFLSINLFTQGALNIWLNNISTILSGYLIFGLIIGEFFVFVAELIGFTALIRENRKWHIIVYVLIANFISLIAGGYLISVLPV